MVESERSHRRGSRKSEFFFCFSSRSSSSMKISSKSILSPGRTREPMSLSSSLSRRLRSNGSMKGGQASPMFPTGSKKKCGSFEPPEPSSPKVTCIGQVRVKSKKKHGRKLRTRSQRRGEVSFRKTEQPQDGIHHQQQGPQECLPHRNQRWVHLPLSICETLRAFGAEFNCFAPCGSRNSSCSWSNGREKVEKRRGGSTSCGAVFARWLFALQESEEKGRETEPVVREEEKREYRENREVVRDIEMEVLEEELETKGEEIEEEEVEEPRESICIPPKNALLLMRSRSAPFRMSSLANRFWESPAPQESNAEELEIGDIKEEEDMENEDCGGAERDELDVEQALAEDKEVRLDLEEGNREEEMLENLGSVETFEDEEIKETQIKEGLETPENVEQQQEDLGEGNAEVMDSGFSLGSLEEREGEVKFQVEEKEEVKEIVEKKEERRVSFSSSTMYLEPEEESDLEEEAEQALEERVEDISPRSRTEQQINGEENEEEDQEEEEEEEEEEEKSLLPECLLLMMCEPKLSMEVSKETWVCSTDFVRIRHPEKKVNQKNGGDESTKKRLSTDSNPVKPTHPVQQKPMQQQKKQEKHVQVEIQPPRSSCSKVIATVIEQKLTNAAGAHEPFVLKRSKSEPMRNSAKLAPEVCFWNKNKLEPHRPPSLGVGATGIGF